MRKNSKKPHWDITRTSTTNNWAILHHSKPKCLVRLRTKPSFYFKCIFTTFPSRFEITSTTASWSWIPVGESLWAWLMWPSKRNCSMLQELLFTFSRPFIKDLGATFRTSLGTFGWKWIGNSWDWLESWKGTGQAKNKKTVSWSSSSRTWFSMTAGKRKR